MLSPSVPYDCCFVDGPFMPLKAAAELGLQMHIVTHSDATAQSDSLRAYTLPPHNISSHVFAGVLVDQKDADNHVQAGDMTSR